MSRTESIKLLVSKDEKQKLEARANNAGFTGRGAITSYIRWREELDVLAPGAPIGNKNKKGKKKDAN